MAERARGQRQRAVLFLEGLYLDILDTRRGCRAGRGHAGAASLGAVVVLDVHLAILVLFLSLLLALFLFLLVLVFPLVVLLVVLLLFLDGGLPAPALRSRLALAVRVVLTAVFALGLVYFALIVRTFASYGEREMGWRRSWLATGHPGLGERARERRRLEEEERERERDDYERRRGAGSQVGNV